MTRKALRLIRRIGFVGLCTAATFPLSFLAYLALQLAIEYGEASLAPLKAALLPLMIYALAVWVHRRVRENQTAHEADWQILAYFASIALLWALLFVMVRGVPMLWGNGSVHNLLQAFAMLLVLGFPLAYPPFVYGRYIRKGRQIRKTS